MRWLQVGGAFLAGLVVGMFLTAALVGVEPTDKEREEAAMREVHIAATVTARAIEEMYGIKLPTPTVTSNQRR